MWNTSFTIDPKAALLLISIGLLAYFVKKNFPASQPHFFFSSLKDFNLSSQQPGSSYWFNLPKRLYQAMILLFALAFLDPHLSIPKPLTSARKPPPSTEGIAIYLLVDQSGSMAQPLIGSRDSTTKMDFLKKITKNFITDRSSDLIGLVSFARTPQVLAPLTLDQDALLRQLDKIDVVKTQEEDGTALGYAIFKTAHLIVATRHFAQSLGSDKNSNYNIKNAIIVTITDGFQDPNILDRGNRLRTIELDEMARYLQAEKIKLYIVNIDPMMGSEQYAPHRRQLERIVAQTGGQFFLVQHPKDLQTFYNTINELEKSSIQDQARQSNPVSYQRISFYPFLLGLGLLCLFVAWILDSTLLKKGP